jgi:hypothetical protein
MSGGRTLWQMLVDRFSRPREYKVYNPLRARVGFGVTIDEIEWRELEFSLREIHEYKRRFGRRVFVFSDYVLTAKPLNQEEVTIRLRLSPTDDPSEHGGVTHHVLLLQLLESLGFDKGLHKAVTDNTGKFQILEDGVVQEEYFRLNDLRTPYRAHVKSLVDIDRNRRITYDEVKEHDIDYWDYSRELKDAAGQPETEYLFVEMDVKDGWFELWKGEEIDPKRVIVM